MTNRNVGIFLGIAVFLLYLGTIIYVELPSLTDRYTVNDDIRMKHFWMGQFKNRELFQDDLLTHLTKPYKDIILFKKDRMFVLNIKRLEENAI